MESIPTQGHSNMRYNSLMNWTTVKSTMIWLLGALWALPITLVGALAGLSLMLFGARASISDSALVFSGFRLFGNGAVTLGQVILNARTDLDGQVLTYHCAAHGGNDCVRIGSHERAHVYQYMAFGIFFLPLYFLHGGISHKNRFEQAADRYAQSGQGWWPY
jgi:hypothetical protein